MKISPWAANMWNGVFFLIIAALFGWQGTLSHDGGDWALSPALFPLLLSGALALLSLALLLQGYRHLRAEREECSVPMSGEISMKKASLVFTLCILYAFFLPLIGFFIATLLFLAVFSLLVGERRPWLILLVSTLSPAVIFVVFRHGLKVLLP